MAASSLPRYNKEPVWQAPSYYRHQVPNSLRHWLLDTGSLTQKLIQLSDGQFRVQVIQQRVQQPRLSESRLLKLPSRRHAVIREVVLYGRETPWVFARTVIPLTTLSGPVRRLRSLGNRPLGGALFADPSLQRHCLQVAPVNTHQVASRTPALQPYWGRRSLFLLKNKPLLVSEIFLHQFPCQP